MPRYDRGQNPNLTDTRYPAASLWDVVVIAGRSRRAPGLHPISVRLLDDGRIVVLNRGQWAHALDSINPLGAERDKSANNGWRVQQLANQTLLPDFAPMVPLPEQRDLLVVHGARDRPAAHRRQNLCPNNRQHATHRRLACVGHNGQGSWTRRFASTRYGCSTRRKYLN
jgi:hypothetical protein